MAAKGKPAGERTPGQAKARHARVEVETLEIAPNVVTPEAVPNVVTGEAAEAAVPEEAELDNRALFEKLFGKQSGGGSQRVMAALVVDGRPLGQAMILLAAGGAAPRVLAEPLLDQLRALLAPSVWGALNGAVDSDGHLGLTALTGSGLGASFDEPTLALNLAIPPELRRTVVTNLRARGAPAGLDDALRPSPFAAYLNARVGEDYVHRARDQADTGRQPAHANFSGAVNVKGVVLEVDANYAEDADVPLARGDVRVIVDDPERMLRYAVGDLSVPIRAYQRGLPMVGATVARNFSLQPYRVTEPISQYEFLLKSPSTVEVWVNDSLRQTFHLPAGRHDLRDLPLSVGFNEVKLTVIDDVGRHETISFDAVSESELLAPGLQQFAYSVGFPRSGEFGPRSYDGGRPTLSVFHRLGVANGFTLGAFVQAQPGRQLAGAEGLWANRLGLWGLDFALSGLSEACGIYNRYAARLGYRKRDLEGIDTWKPTWGANVETVGRHFSAFGLASDSGNPYRVAVSAYYAQRLPWGITGNLSGDYRFFRGDVTDPFTVGLSLGRTLWDGLYANLDLSHRRTLEGTQDQRVFISLTWVLPQQHQYVSMSHDTQTEATRAAWRYLSPGSVNNFQAGAEVNNTPRGADLTGSLEYTGYRAETRFSHTVTAPAHELSDVGLRSDLRFGSALVFVGGHFGVSRPISDSFALVVPNQKLAGQLVRLNPLRDQDAGRVDGWGPGVLPALHSYHLTTLTIDAPELPFGYELGQTAFALLPTYRSGFFIPAGTEASVFLRGTLLDASGTPFALEPGLIVSVDAPEWGPVAMFTNRKGRFATEGMKPGHYELRMVAHAGRAIRFDIPEEQVGIYSLGSLRVGPAPEVVE